MIGLLQRVSEASVSVDGDVVGRIGRGLLVLLCAEQNDTEKQADALLDKLLGYRVFPDDAGKMNRSLRDVDGALLLVPQFTLAADTRSGTRPSFTPAARPDVGERLFRHTLAEARRRLAKAEAGRFGAHMQVSLVNDGPVTFWLRVAPPAASG